MNNCNDACNSTNVFDVESSGILQKSSVCELAFTRPKEMNLTHCSLLIDQN